MFAFNSQKSNRKPTFSSSDPGGKMFKKSGKIFEKDVTPQYSYSPKWEFFLVR